MRKKIDAYKPKDKIINLRDNNMKNGRKERQWCSLFQAEQILVGGTNTA